MADDLAATAKASETSERPLAPVERPAPSAAAEPFASDAIADTLRALDLRYIAMVPGSSFRGLQDSLVNHLGNKDPRIIVCLHEEASVAIAHGYAKVTGRAMAAALHCNVGLLHAAMAVFNAWCDRMPMLLIGATGPLDAAQRRPWIEWIHTSRDQAASVRPYLKWDDTPASVPAAREALARAVWIAETVPQGPTFVTLDAGLQEARHAETLPPLDLARLMPAITGSIGADAIATAAKLLRAAQRPVIMVGRVGRDLAAWQARVALAERLGARIVTDLKVGAGFPTDHPLCAGTPALRLVPEAAAAVREADVVLSLDWVDLGGTLKTVAAGGEGTKVIQVSRDHVLHNGANMDYQALAEVDLFLSADPDAVVADLLPAIGDTGRVAPAGRKEIAPPYKPGTDELTIADLAHALRGAIGERPATLTHLPLSWHGGFWPFHHPLDYLGTEGGAGVGGGPGIAVGAALALKDSGRLPIAICGDGDFLMGHTALWTAVHYGFPLLLVVANNRSYFNDEQHQERVALHRGRAVENKWIGQRLSDPEVDLAALGRAQGAEAFGPVRDLEELNSVFAQAVEMVAVGKVVVVDVRIRTGYA